MKLFQEVEKRLAAAQERIKVGQERIEAANKRLTVVRERFPQGGSHDKITETFDSKGNLISRETYTASVRRDGKRVIVTETTGEYSVQNPGQGDPVHSVTSETIVENK